MTIRIPIRIPPVWEYQMIYEDEKTLDELNRLGAEGWEINAVCGAGNNINPARIYLRRLKREVS